MGSSLLCGGKSPARWVMIIAGCLGVVLLGSGCVSQKPLPFTYSTPLRAPIGAPTLAVLPAQDARGAKDDMDEALRLPQCLDAVIVQELANSSLFSNVELQTNGQPKADYVLQCKINKLSWDVPDYDDLLGTEFIVSFLTGGVGGVIYGCTDTDVFGYADINFNLVSRRDQRPMLNRDYDSTFIETKIKFKCDTPNTYREVAAKSLRMSFDRFENDARQMNLK